MAFHLESNSIDARALSAKFEAASLDQILTWCWEKFGAKAAIGTSFQGSGIVIMHHAWKLGLPFSAFTVDTGLLFPETLELKTKLEQRFGFEIESLHPDQTVEEQAAESGPELWKRHPDTCCVLRKVVPLQKKLTRLDVWITGLRRQQSETRQRTQILELYKFDVLHDLYIFKLNPMATWSRDAVRDYLRKHDLPSNPLQDQGYRSIGCMPCTRPVGDNDGERAGRWTGFDKSECGIHTFLGNNI
jgi:phosphoadenosine phosphosulfate reductase